MSDHDRKHKQPIGHQYMKSWHEPLTDEQKQEIADEHRSSECWLFRCCGIFGYWSGFRCCCCGFAPEEPMMTINKHRYCTDVPCLLLFFLALLLQLYIFIYALEQESDPRWLVYYSDWEGQLCAPHISVGNDGRLIITTDPNASSTAGAYAAWPDIRMYDIRVCVSNCSDTLTDARMVTPPFDADLEKDVYVNGSLVALAGYEAASVFGAYCIPNPDAVQSITDDILETDYTQFTAQLDKLTDTFSLAMNDIHTCWLLFILCGITAFLVSMIWGCCLRYVGGIIIWGSIFLTLFGVFGVAYFLITYSDFAYDFGYTTIGDLMYYGGYVIGVIDLLFAFAVCFMWHRIRLAIALAKETTRAMNALWQLFFYPLIPFLWFAMYIVYWLISGTYIGSVLEAVDEPFPLGYEYPYYTDGPTLKERLGNPTHYTYLQVSETWQNFLLIHFFILLWMVYFVSYHTYMVTAGVYAEWYFADWKTEKEVLKKRGKLDRHLSKCPVCTSFGRVTRYHMGSLAFGSLLIAIIEFIEYTITYFEKRFIGAEPSPLKECLLAAIRCLLRCLKCILNRINRNGYIITSIYGWPFCAASIRGITIIVKNVIRASALSMVSGYLEKLGKICILSFNTALMCAIAYYMYFDELSTMLVPALVCMGITWVVCWQYMHLYEVGLSTIFICFLIDEEKNRGGHMRASRRLKKIIGEQTPSKPTVQEFAKSDRHTEYIEPAQKRHFADQGYDKHDRNVLSSGGALDIEWSYHSDEDNKRTNLLSAGNDKRGRVPSQSKNTGIEMPNRGHIIHMV